MESSLRRWSFARLLGLWCGCLLLVFGFVALLSAAGSDDLLFTDITLALLLVTAVAMLLIPIVVSVRWCAVGAHWSWHAGQLAMVWVVIGILAMAVWHAGGRADRGWMLLAFVAPVALSALYATWTWFDSREQMRRGPQITSDALSGQAASHPAAGDDADRQRRRRRAWMGLGVCWFAMLAYFTLGPTVPWRVKSTVRDELEYLRAVQDARAAAHAPYLVTDVQVGSTPATGNPTSSIFAYLDSIPTLTLPARVATSECHTPACTYVATPGIQVRIWATPDGWEWGATARDARNIIECRVREDNEPNRNRYRSGYVSCTLAR